MDFSSVFGSVSIFITIWYPASGCRGGDDGALCGVGNGGCYWSASPYDSDVGIYAYSLDFGSGGVVYPSSNRYCANGYAVRCVRESK